MRPRLAFVNARVGAQMRRFPARYAHLAVDLLKLHDGGLFHVLQRPLGG
jgi:hypothetical protein